MAGFQEVHLSSINSATNIVSSLEHINAFGFGLAAVYTV